MRCFIAFVFIFVAGAYCSAESLPDCEVSGRGETWRTIHNARARTSVVDSKNMVTRVHMDNPLLYSNTWQDNVKKADGKRIVDEFAEDLIPSLVIQTFNSYKSLVALPCDSEWKSEVMEYVKYVNNLLLTEPVILDFKYKFGEEVSDVTSSAGDKGLSLICGKDPDLSDPCFGPGAVIGGGIATIVSAPFGLLKGVFNFPRMSSGKVAIAPPPGMDEYFIP